MHSFGVIWMAQYADIRIAHQPGKQQTRQRPEDLMLPYLLKASLLDLNLQKNPNKSALLQEMPFGSYQHHSLNTLTCREPAPHFNLRATSALPTFVQQRNNTACLKRTCLSYWAEWLFIDDLSAFLQAVDDSVPCQEVKHIGLRGLMESNSFLFKKHT